MINTLLWLLALLPLMLLFETSGSVRKYIFSGKLFFAESREVRLKPRVAVFLMIWSMSIPVSLASFIILAMRMF